MGIGSLGDATLGGEGWLRQWICIESIDIDLDLSQNTSSWLWGTWPKKNPKIGLTKKIQIDLDLRQGPARCERMSACRSNGGRAWLLVLHEDKGQSTMHNAVVRPPTTANWVSLGPIFCLEGCKPVRWIQTEIEQAWTRGRSESFYRLFLEILLIFGDNSF